MKNSNISRVVIKSDNNLLLIRRIKHNKEYYVLPGGHIENNETPEETAIREAKEETNLDITLGKVYCNLEEMHHGTKRSLFCFDVKEFSGKLQLGGEEKEQNCNENQYHLEWHPLKDLKELNILPIQLKEELIKNDNNLP